MMSPHSRVALLLAFLLSASTALALKSPRLASVELPPGLRRVLTDYENAWTAKDPAALARLFTEDGFVLPNGGEPVRGREAIQAYYANSGGPLFLRAFAFATEGAVGYIIGAYAMSPEGIDVGKFTLTLRREKDGRWLIRSDMDNGNQPRRPQPPPTGSRSPTS